MNNYRYRIYGMVIESELECPGLVTAADAEPDVFVRIGNVPDKLENTRAAGFKFQANSEHVLMKGQWIDMLVSDGERITIQWRGDVSQERIRAFFLAWGLGALLHQRNIFPLHGSVIGLGAECVAFCAPSGTGKSSLAALFVKKGYALLDDNIAAIARVDGVFQVYPGAPLIRFTRDVMERAGDSLSQFGPAQPVLDKYAVQVRQNFSARPQPLKKIYALARSGRVRLTPLNGAVRFDTLMQNTFCPQFLRGMEKFPRHFQTVWALAAQLPVVDVELPEWPTPFDGAAEMLERDFLA